jgi:hypothetical protein
MSTAVTLKRIAETSPRSSAGITTAFYLFTMLLGGLVLFVHGRSAVTIDLIATACYLAVTALFYALSRPAIETSGRRGNG